MLGRAETGRTYVLANVVCVAGDWRCGDGLEREVCVGKKGGKNGMNEYHEHSMTFHERDEYTDGLLHTAESKRCPLFCEL